jgi:response regulator RpfG family c-di-GMP phosphodiesterase
MTPLTSVLIVDDEPAVRDIMARWAASLGLSARTAANADEALATLRTERCDLAVIDIMMPGRDGLWLAGELRRDHPQTAVVLATACTSLLDGEADAPPIADLLIKPFARDRFVMAVDRGRYWRKEALDERGWQARLSIELRDRTEIICVEVARQSDADARESSVLSEMALSRTPDAMAHGERVAGYAAAVARELGLNGAAVEQLETVARFHDIGKLAIPDSLLNKPSLLTPAEQRIVRRHVDAGAEILASTRALHQLAGFVLATHEWFGGGGYPLGLTGEAIPLPARIVAVVDAYDAMTEDRPYGVRLDSAEAVCELLRCAGTQFDPAIVDAFLAVLGGHS